MSFRDDLKRFPSNYEQATADLKRISSNYKRATADDLQNYTFQVATLINQALNKNFKGIITDTKGRIKSQTSYSKKLDRKAKEVENNNPNENAEIKIFDIFGCKTFILGTNSNEVYENLGVPENLTSKRDFIIKKIEEKRQELKTTVLTSSEKNHICVQQNLLDQEYKQLDNSCQCCISDKMFESISEIIKQPPLDELGLYVLSERNKKFNNPNGYIANHLTLASTLHPDWNLEWQFKSNYDYITARDGTAAHKNREGKKLLLPSDRSIDGFYKFFDSFPDASVVRYFVCTESKDSANNTQTKAIVYIPNKFENLYHQYQVLFSEIPNLEDVLSDFVAEQSKTSPGKFLDAEQFKTSPKEFLDSDCVTR